MLSEVDALLRLFYHTNYNSDSWMIFFSSSKYKPYLRSTMSACRVNNAMLLHCHKDIADGIDVTKIAKSFVSVNSRRQNYFWTLCIFCDDVYRCHYCHKYRNEHDITQWFCTKYQLFMYHTRKSDDCSLLYHCVGQPTFGFQEYIAKNQQQQSRDLIMITE